MVGARHFSLDCLLGGPGSWTIVGSRAGLPPLGSQWLRDMVVCEPLMLRFKIIHPPMDFDDDYRFYESYLVDGCNIDEVGARISMSNFRVRSRCILERSGHMHTAMFTMAGDTGLLWSEKTIVHGAPMFTLWSSLGHASGSWYFYVGRTLIIDPRQ
ncbi:hypothetical protein BAE44_0010380 [Dichanthelium oligosanthes]|uniref:Uncharacterized protein n=1 Tax=Dichanthelium oligosanthes TaxID=888268 RepID=A0A1E5VU11_9POAL|nr:hypothetical protein BAE44_0010380 [Dichanthelium oligosanthes]